MTILLLAEHDGLRISPDTARAVGAVMGLGDTVHVLVAGSGVGEIAAAASRIGGVGKVLHADGPSLEHQLAEPLAGLIVSLVPELTAKL